MSSSENLKSISIKFFKGQLITSNLGENFNQLFLHHKAVEELLISFGKGSTELLNSTLIFSNIEGLSQLQHLSLNFAATDQFKGINCDIVISILAAVLKCPKLLKLHLNLKGNQLTTEDFQDITKTIQSSNSLQHLFLNFKNNSIKFPNEIICPLPKNLKELNLNLGNNLAKLGHSAKEFCKILDSCS